MSEEKKLFVRNGRTYRIYAPADLSQRWFVYFHQNGKRVRRYGNINTMNTRSSRLVAAERVIDDLVIESAPYVSDVHAKILSYLAEKKPFWRLSTYQQYASIIKLFFEWLQEQEPTRDRVVAFFVDLRKRRHATTYNKYLMHLRQLFDAVGCYGLFEGLEKVKTQATPLRYFQKHQIDRLKNYMVANDLELWRFVQLIFYCFIRPKELRNLQACDIMLHEEMIFVPGKKSKNKKDQYITIPDVLMPDLNWVYDLSPADYLFPSPVDRSKPIGRNTLYKRHHNILQEMNFGPYYSLYSWKHTGAVMAAKAGISVKELQIQLRHHSLDETDKYLRQMGVSDLMHLKSKFPTL